MQRQANEVPLVIQQANPQPIQNVPQAIAYPQEGNPVLNMPPQGMQSPNLVLPAAQAASEQSVPNLIPAPPQIPPPLGSTSSTTNALTTESVVVPPPLVPATPLAQPQLESTHSNLRNGVRYFYYDPHATTKDAHGNLYLPEFVYDANGQAIHLASLSSKSIYVAPPRTMIRHNITASNSTTIYNYTHPNTIHTPVHEHSHGEPPKGMVRIQDWGTSHSSDSSVIVGTVGVMALLVGALSARKLRSRNMLSACIENETLEDEAAYDAAHTHHYNTFQQGWKGDLEKFDV